MVLVEDVLDMIKFSINTFSLDLEFFKLKEILSEIKYIFAFQWEEKHLNFAIEWESDPENIIFRSDKRRIKQVLINLISNSYKFTEEGSITLKIKSLKNHNAKYLQFTVIDTGIGISKADMTKLFKMFAMVSNL